jgi:hypothetical protein
MTKKKEKNISACVIITWADKTVQHQYFTDVRDVAFKQADSWAAEQMKARPNESVNITFLEVVHSINF